jgi:hypothetical protein
MRLEYFIYGSPVPVATWLLGLPDLKQALRLHWSYFQSQPSADALMHGLVASPVCLLASTFMAIAYWPIWPGAAVFGAVRLHVAWKTNEWQWFHVWYRPYAPARYGSWAKLFEALKKSH